MGALVDQHKARWLVPVELLEAVRTGVSAWWKCRSDTVDAFASRIRTHHAVHISRRQHARRSDKWVTGIELARSRARSFS